MPGTWTVTANPVAPIHTFIAPEDGWSVTSHILDLPSELFVIDTQYTLSFEREVVRYAKGLNKPLTRVYATHYHPDHLLGAAVFDAPLYALDSVANKIAEAGDRVAREEHEKVGGDVATTARQPDQRIIEGYETIDGVRLTFRRLRCAKTEDALVIALPDARTIIAQNLVYSRSHLSLGERDFDGWRAALRDYRALPYDTVLPGHGLPGGRALYDEMIAYLDFAEAALGMSRTAGAFKQSLLDRFPAYGCRKVLDHQLRFLFPPAPEANHA